MSGPDPSTISPGTLGRVGAAHQIERWSPARLHRQCGYGFATCSRSGAAAQQDVSQPYANVSVFPINRERAPIYGLGTIPLTRLLVRSAQIGHQLHIVGPDLEAALERRYIETRDMTTIENRLRGRRPLAQRSD